MKQVTRRRHDTTPARWQNAALRAITEGIQVRQVNANGMWVATPGTDSTLAYVLEINQGIVQSCTCPAGTFGDPVCKHSAAFYLDAGLLETDDPEPDPPVLGAMLPCTECNGCGVLVYRSSEERCPDCGGSGIRPDHRPHGAPAVEIVAA